MATCSRRWACSPGSCRPRHLRAVSILPLSHLLEQVSTLLFGTMMGAEIVYVRSRNPRVIVEAMRELGANAIVGTPQLLELLWVAITRRIEQRGLGSVVSRARRIARHLPCRARRIMFRPLHAPFGGRLDLMVSSGSYLPPELQQAWEDIGVVVLQGYGSTEVGFAVANDEWHHPPGLVGRAHDGVDVRIDPETHEIQVRGPGVSAGLLARRGQHHGLAHRGRLVPHGRHRRVHRGRRPAALGPTEEHHRAAQRPQRLPRGHRGRPGRPRLGQAVVLETKPGRIEAVVLPPGSVPILRADQEAANDRPLDDGLRAEIDAAVKAANADLSMSPTHRRLAPVARTGLPAHPHHEDQAQSRARVGRRRRRPAGARGRVAARPTCSISTGVPTPAMASKAASARSGSSERRWDQVVKMTVSSSVAHGELGVRREVGLPEARRQVVGQLARHARALRPRWRPRR